MQVAEQGWDLHLRSFGSTTQALHHTTWVLGVLFILMVDSRALWNVGYSLISEKHRILEESYLILSHLTEHSSASLSTYFIMVEEDPVRTVQTVKLGASWLQPTHP